MDWQELLTTLIKVVLLPAIPIIVAAVVKFATAKAEEAIAASNSSILRATLLEATKAVATAVTYTAQTFVDDLKSAGTFTKEAQAAALATALSKTLILISTESKELLTSLYGNLEEWLTTKIEQQVKEQKASATVSAA
jgi:hypothetical protein